MLPLVLVVRYQVQNNKLRIRYEGCYSTGSVVLCVEGVNGQLVLRVRFACLLFWNEFSFIVKGLDVEMVVGVNMFGLLRVLSRAIRLFIDPN